jgi:putative DNA primase/helicase
MCGGTDRFSINTRKQLWNCRQCKPKKIRGDVIGLGQWLNGVTFEQAVEILTGERLPAHIPREESTSPSKESEQYDREQHEKAAWLWSRRVPIIGSIAERYLREARKITCALPPTLGFLPAHKDHAPALIAASALVEEIEPDVLDVPRDVRSVHLVTLKPDGSDKADIEVKKRTIGRPGKLPIILAPVNDLLGLAVTEGIEDGLTVHLATGLGVWAAATAGRMQALGEMIPSYIEAVTIYSHADDSGQANARHLADALLGRQIEVRVEGLR